MAKKIKELKDDKELRDKIVAQSLDELIFDRRYKQGKITNWQKNESMYYGLKKKSDESRSNVDLARMQDHVHTILSKIDNPLLFKFVKRKKLSGSESKRLNALRTQDALNDNWDIKDLVGKKQGLIYGRAIYFYYAESDQGYCPHLDNTDVYDFLIDPSGGGIDIECALNMGRYGVVKTKDQLQQGIDNGYYLKDETTKLINGDGNSNEPSQESTNKKVRQYGQGTIGQTENEVDNADKYKFWEWYTTFYNQDTKKSERYYLLMQEQGATAIRVEKLSEMFTPAKEGQQPMWPCWSYAVFPDLTEFWTPSFCDYVREIFMAQSVSVNQLLDNSEEINKPMTILDTGAIENLAEWKYRRSGIIKVKSGFDVTRAVQFVRPPALNAPIAVFNLLEEIKEKSSGVTSQTNGTAATDGKVGIYEGNQEASADKFGLLNRSYAFGYKRFAKLYELGVRDHLTKKIAIDMIGPDGIETEMVGRSDIFYKKDDFGVMVEASNAETQTSIQTQTAKLTFLNGQVAAQSAPGAMKIINPKKAFEYGAKTAGFEDEEIAELMDITDYGTENIISECDRDIESLLDGQKTKPNPAANAAYMQRMLDWMTNHEEDMTDKQKQEFIKYMHAVAPIATQNEARSVNQHMINTLNQGGQPPAQQPADGQQAPVQTNPVPQGVING